ncbi:MAG: preprotein translocase subunit SecA [Trueperaceae bacterium]|nr:preprotein translocase subunit SecA [Trueperaceae bacterium]
MLNRLLTSVFGSRNERLVNQFTKVVAKVNALESQMQALSDAELQAKTPELRQRVADGESLDKILHEAFAVCREASVRVLGMRHYDVQLVGGMVLHTGRIAEMRTGEGKTLVATLPVYLNALAGKGAHVVTVNDYLARRDAAWMGKLYTWLGMSVGVVYPGMAHGEKHAAYTADITYATNNEIGFDYLRDNMALAKADRFQRGLNFAIIDEVDSILIDEARTPLIISGPAELATDKYYVMAKLAARMEKGVRGEDGVPSTGDYTTEDKSKDVHLTEQGIARAEKELGVEDIFSATNMELGHMLRQAIRSREHYKLDQQYVKDEHGQVVIVDEFTGRLMPGRRFGEGLHQAIEAKEGVKIERENQTLATITYQNFFKLYDKIAGMTGTAKTEEKEFQEIYGTDVLTIPTNKPMVRDDGEDVVFRTQKGKYENVVDEIVEVHSTGQPVLVGTVTIESSELLSKMLARKGVKHEVLNAKYHGREAEIVSQAGRIGAVTISTNMAGRGTDIVLGGNAEALARQLLEREGFDRYDSDTELFIKAIMLHREDEARQIATRMEGLPAGILERIANRRDEAQRDHETVVGLGGLHIIGTERHESRRIDNQLRGRAGRQGDPGSSRFYVSFEDDLMRLFANERVLGMMDRLGMDDTQPIEAKMVTGAIEKAQKRVEDRNFGIRKQLIEYDNVMSKQREVIYAQRRDILLGNDIRDDVQDMVADYVDSQVQRYLNPELEPEEREVDVLRTAVLEAVPQLEGYDFEQLRDLDPEEATQELVPALESAYGDRENELGTELLRELERFIVLQVVDQHWKEHLHSMDVLRQGIGLRGYGQRNPLQEYAFEGFNLFEEMKSNIKLNVAKLLFRVQVQTEGRLERRDARAPLQFSGGDGGGGRAFAAAAAGGGGSGGARGGKTAPITVDDKVGRNDPCPCGSGKKYKHCHGRAAA